MIKLGSLLGVLNLCLAGEPAWLFIYDKKDSRVGGC